jgi:hypothetical protein
VGRSWGIRRSSGRLVVVEGRRERAGTPRIWQRRGGGHGGRLKQRGAPGLGEGAREGYSRVEMLVMISEWLGEAYL